MRRLSIREVVVCLAVGGLYGFRSRPLYARVPPVFLPADESLAMALCTAGGTAVALGLYALLVWWRRW